MSSIGRSLSLALLAGIAVLALGANAQLLAQGGLPQPLTGGVQITPEGVLSSRLVAPKARPGLKPENPSLAYVSLPRLLESVRDLAARKQNLPADVRFLGGLTQIQHVFVFPEEHDIVLAGTAEPLDTSRPGAAVGKNTGRPAVQLDDLIVALRVTAEPVENGFFGCSLDLRRGALAAARDALQELGNASNATIADQLKKTLGPQAVRVFGLPPGSRMAMGMLAADYRLKRLSMGVEAMPVPGIGNGLGNEAASNRLWFVPAYEPLLMSPDGNAYELRGQRLKVEAGAQLFEARGASEAARDFARNFSEKMPSAADAIDSIADLQNIADLLVVAKLIRQERLAGRAGVDLAWAMKSDGYSALRYPAPTSADTIVSFPAGSVVAGGVFIEFKSLPSASPAKPGDQARLEEARKRPQGNDWLMVTSGAAGSPARQQN